ncbi:hypothetical protein K491DRAFT_718135 [Lophiostoma macrostomum CBS 122681]|uniref:Extracellular membrane protein CFEM domain-containing protein n=1 Tax=Lophiostoma macrostomum CBS 122681 TaxID=1314788 RepID=A0A6A6T2D5_9PLEO|nr:hypothetical protein K491DRAFT_718135 [Lophiostoma macrostomum CBS 122681]
MRLFAVFALFVGVAVAAPADGRAPADSVSPTGTATLSESATSTESAIATGTPNDVYKTACLNKYKYYTEHFKCGKPGSNPLCETVARKETCIWNPECRRWINCPCDPCGVPSVPALPARAVETKAPAVADDTKATCERDFKDCVKVCGMVSCYAKCQLDICEANPTCWQYIDHAEPEPVPRSVEADSSPVAATLTKYECKKAVDQCAEFCGRIGICVARCRIKVINSNPECRQYLRIKRESEPVPRDDEANSPSSAEINRKQCFTMFDHCAGTKCHGFSIKCLNDCRNFVIKTWPECDRFVKKGKAEELESEPESEPQLEPQPEPASRSVDARSPSAAQLTREECIEKFTECLNNCNYPYCAFDCKTQIRTEYRECRMYVKRQPDEEPATPAIQDNSPVVMKDPTQRECDDHWWQTCGKKCGWVDCQFNCQRQVCRWNEGCRKYSPYDVICFKSEPAKRAVVAARAVDVEYRDVCLDVYKQCMIKANRLDALFRCEREACHWNPVECPKYINCPHEPSAQAVDSDSPEDTSLRLRDDLDTDSKSHCKRHWKQCVDKCGGDKNAACVSSCNKNTCKWNWGCKYYMHCS